MMRRLVDASIPAVCLIAVIPAIIKIMDLPASLQRSLGILVGHLWAIALGAAMLLICIGIIFRRFHPATAFKLEWPALVFAGCISSIYGTIIFYVAGVRGWVAAWFVYAIAAHCIFRFLELSRARKLAAKAQT